LIKLQSLIFYLLLIILYLKSNVHSKYIKSAYKEYFLVLNEYYHFKIKNTHLINIKDIFFIITNSKDISLKF